MQTITNNIAFYVPGNVPNETSELPRFLQQELYNIQSAINMLSNGHIEMSYVAPTKPFDGDIRLADGTSWNPGSGKGVYGYYNAAWHLLG